jgi:alkaline phosphatase
MSWRNKILAVLVMLGFAGFAGFYYKNFARKRTHGIVVFVANGLDWPLLNRARAQAAAQGQTLMLDTFPNVTLLQVQGLNGVPPDEAAAATALACGRRTKNGLVGSDLQGNALESILYAAQKAGRSTGLVTTGSLTEADCAAFYGAGQATGDEHKFAGDLVDGSKIDVVLGGGARSFYPVNVLNERGRTDGRDVIRDSQKKGYYVARTMEELNGAPKWRTGQLFGVFAPDVLNYTGLRRLGTPQPTLADMTRRSIEFLQYNLTGYLGGYFLVVDHALLRRAARQNLTALAVNETLALDEAVRTALDYMGREALIVVVSGYSLGGLDTSGGMTGPVWLSGPGAAKPTPVAAALPIRERRGKKGESIQAPTPAPLNPLLEPDAALRPSEGAEITTGPGLILSRGRSAESFGGIIQNTDVFTVLKREM